MKKLCFPLLICALLAGCGYNRFEGPSALRTPPAPNCDISLLFDFYRDEPMLIRDSIVVSGTVVSSDKAGNFYKTFFMQDKSGALEVLAGITDLHNIYRTGYEVTVALCGLVVTRSDGVLRVGLPPAPGSWYDADYFASRQRIDRYVLRSGKAAEAIPEALSIRELVPRKAGRLVRVGPVRCDTLSYGTWATGERPGVPPAEGRCCFRDEAGDSLSVITSGYARFADSLVPRCDVWLTGILFWEGNAEMPRYAIKLRDLDDVRKSVDEREVELR